MDIKKIAQTLNLNPETTNRVLDAWTQAQQMGSGVKTKQDALNLLGYGSEIADRLISKSFFKPINCIGFSAITRSTLT